MGDPATRKKARKSKALFTVPDLESMVAAIESIPPGNDGQGLLRGDRERIGNERCLDDEDFGLHEFQKTGSPPIKLTRRREKQKTSLEAAKAQRKT